MEMEVLDPTTRGSPERLDLLLRGDFLEFGSSLSQKHGYRHDGERAARCCRCSRFQRHRVVGGFGISYLSDSWARGAGSTTLISLGSASQALADGLSSGDKDCRESELEQQPLVTQSS